MKNNKQDISDSLIKTLANYEATEAISDIAEVGIDLLIQNEAIKEIPILSSLLALWKGGLAIRDYLFLRKLSSFLKKYDSIDEKFRLEFIEKTRIDATYRKEMGEYIISLLERLDQLSKAEAFAKIFAAYLEHKISLKEYKSFSFALDKVNFDDINVLVDFYEYKLSYRAKAYLQNFAFVGLVSISDRNSNPEERHGYQQQINGFNQNTFGQKFLAVLGFENFKNVLSQRTYTDCAEGIEEFGMGAPLCIIKFSPS